MKKMRMRRRGIGGSILILVALACVLTSGIGGIVAADSGPVFDTVTLSASSMARGGTVTVSAHITDGTADVLDAPTIFFLLPDGADGPAIDFTRISGDARDGRYDATVTISPLLPPGQYTVKLLRAYDGDGNIGFMMPPDPRLAALTLTVTDAAMGSASGTPSASATVNATARTTTTAALSPSPAVGMTASALPTVTATAAGTRFPVATATRSPVSTVSQPTPIPMSSPVPTDGPGLDIPSTSTAVPTVAVRVTVLPAATTAMATPRPAVTSSAVVTAVPIATVTATTRATATATSAATATTAAPVTPTATANATLTRPTSTAAATAQRTAAATATTTGAGPVLVSLAVSDATALPGDALIVTARITDSAADVADFPTLRYRLPDGSDGPFAYLRRMDGTARDGTYQAIVGLSPFFPPGIYTIAAVTITDTDGNTTVFSAPTPAQPDATFIVQPFMPPTSTPIPSDAG